MTEQKKDAVPAGVIINVPQPAAPPVPRTPRGSRKPPVWWRRPSTLLCFALAFVLAELVLFVRVGWVWWLVGNLALIVLIVVVGLILMRGDFWRMLAGLFRRSGRGRSSARGAKASRTAGGSTPRGLLGRLGAGGRRGPGKTPGAGGRRGSGKGAAGGRQGPGKATGSGGRRSAGARGLLGRLRGRSPSGKGPGTGNGTGTGNGGAKNRHRWPFGGRRGPGKTPGADGRRGPGKDPARGRQGPGKAPGTEGKGTPHRTGRKEEPGFLGTVADGWKAGWGGTPPGKKPTSKPKPGGAPDHTGKPKTNSRPYGDEPETIGDPDAPSTNTEREEPMTDQRMDNPDSDLFTWGRFLGMAPDQLDAAALEAGKAAYRAEQVATALTRMAQQGASELPADRTLAAEVEAVAARARKAAQGFEAAQIELRGAQADSESLHQKFQAAHETDLARLEGERAARHIEKKADVGPADF